MHATTIAKTGWNMFLVGTTNGAYYNVNGTWLRSSGISDYVSSFAVNPANKSIVIAATGIFSAGSLYISYDYGKSFQPLYKSFTKQEWGLFGIPIEVYWLNITGYPLVCATVDKGILVSLDQGRHWVPINYNLRSGEVTSVWFYNNNLYISTYGEGILVFYNFSIDNLPGTINGFTNLNDLNLMIDGRTIDIYGGHFRAFLKPGNHTLVYLANGVPKTMNISVKPMETYNVFINATPALPPPISQNYTVRFTEVGLPPGTLWYVTLNGQTVYTNSTEIIFQKSNGTYSYIVGTENKDYAPIPSSGTLTVSGGAVNLTVTFNLTKPVETAKEPYIAVAVIASLFIILTALLAKRKLRKQ
jgi:hypothetical protein